MAQDESEERVLGWFVGVVKSFNQEKGYGFISSAGVRNLGYENDAFVHRLQIKSFSAGSKVRFAAYLDKLGKLKARKLQACNINSLTVGAVVVTCEAVDAVDEGYLTVGMGTEVEIGYMGDESKTDERGWVYVRDLLHSCEGWLPLSALVWSGESCEAEQNCKEDGASKSGASKSENSKDDDATSLGQFVGVVKSFNQERGYGFISSAKLRAQGYESDAFVHRLQIKSANPGSAVEFSAYLDTSGKLKARDLHVLDADLAVGVVAVTRRAVEESTSEQGYLAAGLGTEVEILYLSNEEDERAWLYARDCISSQEGWFPRDALLPGEDLCKLRPSGSEVDKPRSDASAGTAESKPMVWA